MPTPDVYRQFDKMNLGRESDITVAPDWRRWLALPSAELLPNLVNDLEPPAFALRPELARLRDNLEQSLARPVRMSGSGSSLFTLYDDKNAAESASAAAATSDVRALPVQLCPLIAW
jgi:4-diphosphocytidyl-2C-methyl-D-erythritol kinase